MLSEKRNIERGSPLVALLGLPTSSKSRRERKERWEESTVAWGKREGKREGYTEVRLFQVYSSTNQKWQLVNLQCAFIPTCTYVLSWCPIPFPHEWTKNKSRQSWMGPYIDNITLRNLAVRLYYLWWGLGYWAMCLPPGSYERLKFLLLPSTLDHNNTCRSYHWKYKVAWLAWEQG